LGIGPRHIGLRLACSKALERFLALVRRHLAGAAEPNAALLGSLAALAGPGADQLALPDASAQGGPRIAQARRYHRETCPDRDDAARDAFVRLGRAFPPALPTLARVRLQRLSPIARGGGPPSTEKSWPAFSALGGRELQKFRCRPSTPPVRAAGTRRIRRAQESQGRDPRRSAESSFGRAIRTARGRARGSGRSRRPAPSATDWRRTARLHCRIAARRQGPSGLPDG